jgi:hypothetical protein
VPPDGFPLMGEREPGAPGWHHPVESGEAGLLRPGRGCRLGAGDRSTSTASAGRAHAGRAAAFPDLFLRGVCQILPCPPAGVFLAPVCASRRRGACPPVFGKTESVTVDFIASLATARVSPPQAPIAVYLTKYENANCCWSVPAERRSRQRLLTGRWLRPRTERCRIPNCPASAPAGDGIRRGLRRTDAFIVVRRRCA